MALLTRLRANSQFGVLDTEADATTQTLSSPEFASLPVVGVGQFLALILDPEKEDGATEIVHVTDHASGATTVTVQRGREGLSSGRVHPSGTVWRHGPTTFDFGEGFQTPTDVAVVFGAGAAIEEGSEDHVALGYNSKAGANTGGGGAATAVGSYAEARGDYSVVVGMATADHDGDIAIGSGAYAWHDPADPEGAVAIGEFADAKGDGAVALGSALAWAVGATAVGRYADARHVSATAIGAGAATNKDHQVKLGTAQEVTTLGGGLEVPIRTVTTATSVGVGDRIVLVDASAGAVTITLPPVAGAAGRVVTIKKIDASANAVTVDGSGTETIDGAATQVLSAQYEDLTVVCDGTAWFIIG